jgi:hypothetical protein
LQRRQLVVSDHGCSNHCPFEFDHDGGNDDNDHGVEHHNDGLDDDIAGARSGGRGVSR